MESFKWDFQPHSVTFSLSARAIFHPSIGSAIVSLPFVDASGHATAPVSLGALNTWEKSNGANDGGSNHNSTHSSPGGRFPGATKASLNKELGSFQVNLDFVKGLTHATLPIRVEKDGAHADAAPRANIQLGPLLVARESGAEGPIAVRDRPSKVAARWTETIGLAGLHRLEIWVTTNAPVLTQEMSKQLLPICFTVDTVTGLPNEPRLQKDCHDVYVEVYPKTSSSTACLNQELKRVSSMGRRHNKTVQFMEPVVYLLGLCPPHAVREWMQQEELIVAVHDRDVQATGAADDGHTDAEKKRKLEVEHPHGIARFKIAPLLQSQALEVALRADVHPWRGNKKQRRAEVQKEDFHAKGILDEEGRQRIENRSLTGNKIEDAPEYLEHGTVCTVNAVLGAPIPEAAKIRQQHEQTDQEIWQGREQRLGESNIWIAAHEQADSAVKSSPQPCRAKLTTSSGEQLVGPWRGRQKDAEEDERHMHEALGEGEAEDHEAALAKTAERSLAPSLGVDRRHERYGRVVLVLHDQETPTIKAIVKTVRLRNAEVLEMDAASAAFDARELTDEEKADPYLDLLTGFVVLDGRCRIMVVEGLRDHGLKEFVATLPRQDQPNSKRFKMLYHSDIGFCERLYNDLGPRLKQIKIRFSVEKLAAKPELYSIAGGITEDILAGMKVPAMLMEIKKMMRAQHLRSGSSFPKADQVVQLEVLYGNYITDEELEGEPVARDGSAAGSSRPLSAISRSQLSQASRVPSATLHIPAGGQTLYPSMASEKDAQDQMSADALESIMTSASPGSMTTKRFQGTRRAMLDNNNEHYERTLELRTSASVPDYNKRHRETINQRSEVNNTMRDVLGKKSHKNRETPFLEGQQVYLYSGQKLNSAELQKAYMRESMQLEQDSKTYSYAPTVFSQNFEYTQEGAEPGIKPWFPKCPSDTYARNPGDTRPIWRNPPARPKEEFRKPGRDVGFARPDELHEAWDENEWHRLPIGDERHKPLSYEVRFELDKVPHMHTISQRPFDRARSGPRGAVFGPPSGFQSVNYHGRAPGENRYEEAEKHNVAVRELDASKIIHDRKFMRSFSHGASRQCVVDMDRHETAMKDPDHTRLQKGMTPIPKTLSHDHVFFDVGRPDLEFQCRMRENHASPPFDPNNGTYRPRDPNVGTKLGSLSGKLGKAPWRHVADANTHMNKSQTNLKPHHQVSYPSNYDFNGTRKPPTNVGREDFLWKSPTRTAVVDHERSKLPYRRPLDYGVQIPT